MTVSTNSTIGVLLILAGVLALTTIGFAILWDIEKGRAEDAIEQRDEAREQAAATATELTGALDRLAQVRAQRNGHRADAMRLMALLNQTKTDDRIRGADEAVRLTKPGTPLPSQLLAIQVVEAAEQITRRAAEGGGLR